MKIFIFFSIFPLLSLACLQYLTQSCQNCPFSHYEALYPSKQILAVSESRKVLLFFVLSIFIFYSLIVKSCFGIFDCMILDKDNSSSTNLKESPNLVCWASQHLKYLLIFGIPSVIIWGVLFPGFLFWILKKHSTILSFADKYSIGFQTKKRNSEIGKKEDVAFSIKAVENDMKKSEIVMRNLDQSKVFVFFL